MEAGIMKRRGFVVNSTVIVLLIPILLLSATYSQIHYQIVKSQSENMELEKLSWALKYVDTDLRNTLQISGKRAILAMVNYTVSNRKFLTEMANNTMKELMLTGKIEGVTSPLMGNQTLVYWFNAVSNALLKRGIILESSGNIENDVEMWIVPLTSFKVAIRARIVNITLKDVNGKVLYRGSIPPKGYAYAIIDIRNVEDPVYAISTNGQYDRIVQPCELSYPEVGAKPIKWLTGLGNASVTNLVGTYGVDVFFNSTSIWSNSPEARLFNLSANPENLFKDGDRGYLYFSNVSVPTVGNNWQVSNDYKYRVKFTVNNFRPNNLTLLIINTNTVSINGETMNQWVAHTSSKASILVYDSNGNPVNFWIEYWDNDGRLWLWIKTTNVNDYYLYLSNDPTLETRGNPGDMFYLLDDFNFRDNATWHYSSGVRVGNSHLTFEASTTGVRAVISNATFSEPFFVRWGMNTTTADTGVGLYRPPSGGQNYIEVTVKYGRSKVILWPFNLTVTSSVSSLDNVLNPPWWTYDEITEYFYTKTDARTAKEWLDSKLAEINGTSVEYKNYQVPIYLNASTVQGIEASGGKAAIRITDDRGNPLPFWIEYWNSNGALIWVKVNLTARYYWTTINSTTDWGWIYYLTNVQEFSGELSYQANEDHWRRRDPGTFYYLTLYNYTKANIRIYYNTGSLTRGNGDKVFEFFDDFSGNTLDTTKWNVKLNGGSYGVSNGILTLKGDNDYTTSDVWLWTKKTFPYYSYVIGLGVKISSSADQGWLWYINSTGEGWMEDVYYDTIGRGRWARSGTFGHLYDFNVDNGDLDYYEDGGNYITGKWTHVEIAIEDYYLVWNHYANITTYQNQSGPFTGTWSGNTSEVSYYNGFLDDIYAQNNTAIGLAQFMGSTQYDFVYVRKYLNLNDLSETVKKYEAENRPVEYEATGSTTQLAIWKNWEELSSKSDSVPSSTFNRYELNVSASRLNLTRITGSNEVSLSGDFLGSWNVSIVAKGAGTQSVDWIIVGPPYVTSGVTFGTLESAGTVVWNVYASAAFDLQPFLSCLINDRYFGVYAAPSFFERLEGKMDPSRTGINGEYWEASKKMQEELGMARDGNYYPIGLVSFIYYPADDSLVSILPMVGQNSDDPQDAIRNSISFADYYWLSYYFNDFNEKPVTFPKAYRAWGISMGTGSYSYLSGVGFLLDNTTAQEIFGSTVWNYLRYKG